MKYLIIADDIGITAPGIVYETVIKELSKHADISVISPVIRDGAELPVTRLKAARKKSYNYRIINASMSLFGTNLADEGWVMRQKRLIDEEVVKGQDLIVSFISSQHYKGVLLGNYLARKYNKKWALYLVDAVPAPIGWIPDGLLYRNSRKFISKLISQCDAFFASNRQMLSYQLEQVGLFNKPSGVLYIPIRNDFRVDCTSSGDSPVFLYTGGLYGPRKADSLIAGFRMVLKDYPDACLVFVGLKNEKPFDSCGDLIAAGNLKLFGFTHDLQKFYDSATVLIDINSFFDNDVFLSSKIVNYLIIKKPIISITGLNSPSRIIFTEDPSIFHCRHDAQEVYLALKKAAGFHSSDWSGRGRYIEMFSVENAVKDFVTVLNVLGNA